MTLIELAVVVCVVLGVAAGLVLGAQFGALGAVGGALGGGVAGLLVVVLLGAAFVIAIRSGEWWRPAYPTCKNGKCHSGDYELLAFSKELSELEQQHQKRGQGIVVRCACGNRYLYSSTHRRFMELRPDASAVPYMVHKPFARRWIRAA